MSKLQFPYLLWCIMTFLCAGFCTLSKAQTTLEYGENILPTNIIKYKNYNGKVTPKINIKDQYSSHFTIVFELKWYDNMGRPGHAIPGVNVYMVDNKNNLSDYSNAINKMLSDKRKNVSKEPNLPPSVQIKPEESFTIGQLSSANGFILKESKALKVNIDDYYSSVISLELILYFVVDKKKELSIDDNSSTLKWEFVLPVQKTVEGSNCDELVRNYKIEFDNQKSSESYSELLEKFNSYQNTQPSKTDWEKLKESVDGFKSGIELIKPIFQHLRNNKDTIWCNELSSVKSDIKNYLADEEKVIELQNNIVSAINNLNPPPLKALISPSLAPTFKENSIKMERYYYIIYDGNGNMENSALEVYKDSINNLKILNDSMEMQAGANIDQQPISRYIKNFHANYEAINEILAKNKSDDEPVTETPIATLSNEEKPDEKKGFPILWVLMPAILVGLAAFGGARVYSYIKKGGGLKSKLKR